MMEPGSPEWLKAHRSGLGPPDRPHDRPQVQEDTVTLPSGEYTKSQLESAVRVAKSQAERRERIAGRYTRGGTQG